MKKNTSIICLELRNVAQETKRIRILNPTEFLKGNTLEYIPEGCSVEHIGVWSPEHSYKNLLARLEHIKNKVKSINAFSEFYQFRTPWIFGFRNATSESKYIYYPLQDIKITQPDKDHVKCRSIKLTLANDSYIEIPVMGTNDRAGGGKILLLIEIELIQPEPIQKTLYIDLNNLSDQAKSDEDNG